MVFNLGQTIENLKRNEIQIDQVTADTGFSSGEALSFCETKGIDAYIPNGGQYKASREGFIFNKELNQYECTCGNKTILPFRQIRTDNKGYHWKAYRSNNSKCKSCALRKKNMKFQTKKVQSAAIALIHNEMESLVC